MQNISNPRKLSPKIFVVCDRTLASRRLMQLLKLENDFTVCGEVVDSAKARSAIKRMRPDLILAVTNLHGNKAFRLLRQVRATHSKIKILVVSMAALPNHANRAMRAGAHGYITIREAPGEIVHAIRDVLAGHIYLSEAVLSSLGGFPRRGGCGTIQCCCFRQNRQQL
jgi:DNA-binding NarL/FixJ family response regulator